MSPSWGNLVPAKSRAMANRTNSSNCTPEMFTNLTNPGHLISDLAVLMVRCYLLKTRS